MACRENVSCVKTRSMDPQRVAQYKHACAKACPMGKQALLLDTFSV